MISLLLTVGWFLICEVDKIYKQYNKNGYVSFLNVYNPCIPKKGN